MWLTSVPNTTCWRELFPTEYLWLTRQMFVDHICMGLYLLFINKVNLFIINKFIYYLIIIFSLLFIISGPFILLHDLNVYFYASILLL